jgi:hypothetical protein
MGALGPSTRRTLRNVLAAGQSDLIGRFPVAQPLSVAISVIFSDDAGVGSSEWLVRVCVDDFAHAAEIFGFDVGDEKVGFVDVEEPVLAGFVVLVLGVQACDQDAGVDQDHSPKPSASISSTREEASRWAHNASGHS